MLGSTKNVHTLPWRQMNHQGVLSPATRLFVQQSNNFGNVRVPHHWCFAMEIHLCMSRTIWGMLIYTSKHYFVSLKVQQCKQFVSMLSQIYGSMEMITGYEWHTSLAKYRAFHNSLSLKPGTRLNVKTVFIIKIKRSLTVLSLIRGNHMLVRCIETVLRELPTL